MMFIILGAGSGLGKTAAVRLAGRPDKIVLSGRREEKLHDTAKTINAAYPNCKPLVEPVDLTDKESINQYVTRIAKHGTELRAFVNTAAGFYKGPFTEQPLTSVDDLISANYSGVVHLIAGILQSVQKALPCDILNVTSISSATNLDSSRSSALHISSKAALHIFGKVLGRELSSLGVRITSIAPGTFARKGRNGISEDIIVDLFEFLLDLPAEVWVESIDIRPTQLASNQKTPNFT